MAQEVAKAKAQTGKAGFDPEREREKLSQVARAVPAEFSGQAVSLFSLLMSMNKAAQQRAIHAADAGSLSRAAFSALQPIDKPFPALADVACQGVEGAYSQIAACGFSRFPPSPSTPHSRVFSAR